MIDFMTTPRNAPFIAGMGVLFLWLAHIGAQQPGAQEIGILFAIGGGVCLLGSTIGIVVFVVETFSRLKTPLSAFLKVERSSALKDDD